MCIINSVWQIEEPGHQHIYCPSINAIGPASDISIVNPVMDGPTR
jgi:hypothetical protein